MHRVAAIQLSSTADVNANLQTAAYLITQAVAEGAELVILPENFALMGVPLSHFVAICEQPGHGLIQDFLSTQALRHNIWLVGGTIPLATTNPQKVRAACLLFDNNGQCIARYDKIHLFDVTISHEEYYHESATIEAGQQVTVIDTPIGRLGLAICYDLRFPELFRCMLDQGVELIACPAAFTATTGKAHWDILIRARAIENLCYLIAANQVGQHGDRRETYGHSMIVDPWGIILNDLPSGTGIVCSDIALEKLVDLRDRFPIQTHRKIFCQ
ncbi:MAG: acyltransferase [Beggiatoa sp. IS2]|nr:MAG: acyltransferase [Beggiatoa sp. IS2]